MLPAGTEDRQAFHILQKQSVKMDYQIGYLTNSKLSMQDLIYIQK